MLHMLYAIHDFKERAEISANCFAKLHPFVFFLSVFIGMPVLTLGAVFLFLQFWWFPWRWFWGGHKDFFIRS